jgi:hypothetical protein
MQSPIPIEDADHSKDEAANYLAKLAVNSPDQFFTALVDVIQQTMTQMIVNEFEGYFRRQLTEFLEGLKTSLAPM